MERLLPRQPRRLADLLRWDIAETPAVLRNRDGALMACLRVRGPDLHSAMGSELVVQAEQLNDCLRRLGGEWMVQTESRRQPVCRYPATVWRHPVGQLVDEERRAHFLTPGTHWETISTVTLVCRGARRKGGGWKHLLYKNLPEEEITDDLPRFEEDLRRSIGLLSGCLEDVTWLAGHELLQYLHSVISFKDQVVAWPEVPAYLGHYLADTDLARVWQPPSVLRWPKLGDQYLRCVSVRRYPKVGHPGMFELLDEINLPYRACTRWRQLSQQAATAEAKRFGGAHWSNRTQGTRPDQTSLTLAQQAFDLQAGIEQHTWSGGYLTQTVVTWGPTFAEATERAEQVEQALMTAGCVTKIEQLNTFSAWLGTLPGETMRNGRLPFRTSKNMAHIGPWQAQTRGATGNKHLQGPPLLMATGRGSAPVGIDPYDDDVGHMMILGPTGSGKSFLLNTLALQWQKYGGDVRIFDKDKSAMVTTYAAGGQWYDLGEEIRKTAASGHRLDDPEAKPWGALWEPPEGRWLCFETNALFDTPEMVPKVLEPLIRSIKNALTGVPTFLPLDEGWRYLQESFFEGKIQDFFLTLRKANAMVVLCTQNPSHILDSKIGTDIYQSCVTKIFLPNKDAMSPKIGKLYEELGLNTRQCEIIAKLIRKRQYYYVGPHGCAVFDLCAGPILRAIPGASSKADLAMAEALYQKNPMRFASEWLLAKGLNDAAIRLDEIETMQEHADADAYS